MINRASPSQKFELQALQYDPDMKRQLESKHLKKISWKKRKSLLVGGLFSPFLNKKHFNIKRNLTFSVASIWTSLNVHVW